MIRPSLFFLLIAALLPGTSFAGSKDKSSLIKIEPQYFELSREFTPWETKKKVWTGKVLPGDFFCKGRYIAEYKDRSGTYFMPPSDCDYSFAFGIWVPDNPKKDSYDTWVIIQKANRPNDYGLLANWLDSMEAGNYKKSGFQIIGPELIDEISRIQPLLKEPSP